MFPQASGKADVVPVFQIALLEIKASSWISNACARWVKMADSRVGFLCFQCQCSSQYGYSIFGEMCRPAGFVFFHPFQVFQQMRETFLFEQSASLWAS